jgi:hypothetical protein
MLSDAHKFFHALAHIGDGEAERGAVLDELQQLVKFTAGMRFGEGAVRALTT